MTVDNREGALQFPEELLDDIIQRLGELDYMFVDFKDGMPIFKKDEIVFALKLLPQLPETENNP